MRKAVLFDQFVFNCQYFNSNTEVNNGFGCNHPKQEEIEEENGKEQGKPGKMFLTGGCKTKI